ncbi:Phosphoenolpyruvate-dihydroxyacetone phosphotransferase, dihydroxyacetone binding subunit DhaK [Pseudonocardia sp. Ae168_Ps1]|nr:Phosphoenolpyruvate-dihydroxyacetone phosphotransferase, dihydroxyacetone binding subunit DhaK [Pseudonocardia sp. Ae150A_Ps1]OLL78442.1 Phosphoenolpyruvate-dihydroxyacetone phosphotransferase, dihydroxyacetone binding subunit DhaK [Pseudonocardia sp. Ae168_Ps1]OLL87432.1 Phosphoenolpyruvate-dihydroxyacetone phosphotransferase, dihydroxyacetone binding subunit DhaK [Pseudonocardia sp. Ae263_Ps1]OLL92539.1 Phosphoenolpyruvate-dihydroxyacetone phosphotransferase, dihydroxyacetone binding subuni
MRRGLRGRMIGRMPFPFHPAGDDPVPVAVRGFARVHADLVELREDPIHLVARHRAPGRRVGLVSGGGSGHEPLHAGFLGRGMLDAVAPGPVFTSPHNKAVLHASRAAAGPGGVIHVVKNYTGDRINFGIAAERLRMEGIDVHRVLVDDDLATDGLDTATGRRGTGATVVVEKILGAAADAGAGAAELAALGSDVAAASRSLAVASRAQTSARTGEPAFALDGELDYGVGIHGERAQRSIPRPPTGELVARMLDEIVAGLPDEVGGPPSSDVVLVVNGMGGTALLELYVLAELAATELAERGLNLAGLLVGTFVPALDMAGFSLTLTRMQPAWKDHWAAPAETAAFPRQHEEVAR